MGQGLPKAEVWRLGPVSVLGEDLLFLSDSPRQSGYDIYRVPSGQSVEDRGYVSPPPRGKTPPRGDPPIPGLPP